MLRINSTRCEADAAIIKLDACRRKRVRLCGILACAVLCCVAAGCEPRAAAQASTPAPAQHPVKVTHPSNAQLADANIEARVDRLLRQMTLEEKIGQLVQYNDTGEASPVPAVDANQGAIAAVNP